MDGSVTRKVGYRNPPEASRFKKGQSGNPKGRPKKVVQPPTSVMTELIKRKIPVTLEGKRKRISVAQAAALALAERAGNGSMPAIRDILAAQKALEEMEAAREAASRPFGTEHFAVWLRTMGTLSDIADLLMFLGAIYITDDGEFHFNRSYFDHLLEVNGITAADVPGYPRLSTPEIEKRGPNWKLDEKLYDKFCRLFEEGSLEV